MSRKPVETPTKSILAKLIVTRDATKRAECEVMSLHNSKQGVDPNPSSLASIQTAAYNTSSSGSHGIGDVFSQ